MKKTGFIAIIGRPNVVKSTLLNSMLGEKIAITSNKPQTTRNKITGILTEGENQFVFLDTPGMHKSVTKLGTYMNKEVSSAINSVDAGILVADARYLPGEIEKKLIKRMTSDGLPIILVLNKTDLTNGERVGQVITAYAQLADYASVIPISAANEDGIQIVKEECAKLLHEGEWTFEEDELTDQTERKIASEIIREKILRLTDDEVPHGIAVIIEEFKDEGSLLRIRADIYCEKASHKGIIIGKNGETMKKIGSFAREDMEKFFATKVFLDLWVKVKENWRESDYLINDFGLNDKSDED
ncbi:MAG: GTPase Era [Clostridia bacterium]|nr:GTPase Era [Clostridia bacterium]